MAKRKTSAALAWMLTAAMAVNSGSIVWAAEDGKISVERIETGETAAFSDSSEEITDFMEKNGDVLAEGSEKDIAAFSTGETENTLSAGNEEITITGITVSNTESIPVLYKQFLDHTFGFLDQMDLKRAVENVYFNIQFSNGESKTVIGLGEVEGYGTLSVYDPYESWRNYPIGQHELSVYLGGEKYDTGYNYSVQDIKDMPEDYKADVQSDDTFVPMKQVADRANVRRFYFENTSEVKKTYQIVFNSENVFENAFVSINGETAECMSGISSRQPFMLELDAGSRAYVEYCGTADEVNVKEKNLVIKNVQLLNPQLFKDLGDNYGKYSYDFEKVDVSVKAEIDGKLEYYIGNDILQLGGITYKIEGYTGKIWDLDDGEYSLTCSFGALPGQEFAVENKLELVSFHKYYKENENPVGEENSSITIGFDKGKPYNNAMCVGATIQSAGTYVVQINYKDTVNVDANRFEAFQWGENVYNGMGGVRNLTSNVKEFKPGTLVVWAENAESVTVTKVSREELEKLCEKCEQMNKTDYTEESWAQLEIQWNSAKELLTQSDISETQIANAIVNLNKAIQALEKNSGTLVTPTPTPSEPTATPTPTPSEPTATPTPTPSEPTATPTPTPSEPTATPTPTPSQPSTPSEPSTPSQPTPAPIPDGYPDGTTSDANGNFTTPNGTVIKNDGTITLPDGSEIKADDQGNKPSIDKEGTVTDTNGTTVDVNGNITLPGAELNDEADNIIISVGKDGIRPQYVQSEGAVITVEGCVISRPGLDDLTAGKGWKVTNDGIATDTEGNVYGADGSVKNNEGTYTKPAKAVTTETNETGNKAKIEVDECNGAQGYDFVVGKSADLLKTKEYSKVVKNQISPEATFAYTDKGTWYVACHAWTRGADGKKVFGQWSEVQEMEITATTPQAPKIKKVTVKGSTVTVTYTASENAEGYDIILGTKSSRVNGEKRPTDYGKNVKKIKGNTYQAVFRNVEEGTYYVAAHAWNRTSEDAKKVFSPWSNIRSTDVE